jgi:hypothetical protein
VLLYPSVENSLPLKSERKLILSEWKLAPKLRDCVATNRLPHMGDAGAF